MKNVFDINPTKSVADSLRDIADELDDDVTATLIIDTDVYYLGKVGNEIDRAEKAIWDMTYGIHKLMKAGLDE